MCEAVPALLLYVLMACCLLYLYTLYFKKSTANSACLLANCYVIRFVFGLWSSRNAEVKFSGTSVVSGAGLGPVSAVR